jgi:hypothetical protein
MKIVLLLLGAIPHKSSAWSPLHFCPSRRSSNSQTLFATVLPTESSRLSKAKFLLEQLSSSDDDDLIGSRPSQQQLIQNNNNNATVVPDGYWMNGHLTADSSVVTRWARGVKVAEPLVEYDPIQAEKLLFRQPTKWLVRNFQIAVPFGIWAAGVALDALVGRQNRRQRAQQLTNAISNLGPAIIKGGQALASRPDLLPQEYLEALQTLQDDVPRFSNDVAFRTVEEELGQKFTDVFELIEEEPIAAASIGQVYRCRLVANGDETALKIQRPGCEEIIALDLYVLRWWGGVYNRIFQLLNRDVDLQSIIDDL